ncbi:MAG TPA: diguanylate cyclase [Longimicrobiaceae bacterium]|nr:diguanylate cyclase [Longimicrobiaceae bacterium]
MIRTLGALRLTLAGVEVLPGRRKELALLAYLARRSPAGASRAELATLMWGERGEARAKQSLRQALLQLRRSVGAALEVDGETVRLTAGSFKLDVVSFETELRAGRPGAALSHWGGPFLDGADDIGGEPYRMWLEEERARLGRLHASALERWVEEAEAAGDWGAMAERAERWTEIFPDEVRPRTRLITALRLSGRSDAALAQHAAFTARARQEGLDGADSPEWLRLGEQLEQARVSVPAVRPRLSSAALFMPDLVGRGGAFAELRLAWEAAQAGRPGVTVVTGEEGLGKTRLIEEFLRWAESTGEPAVILRARAYESERAVAWSTARDLLAPLRDAPGVGGAADGALAELSRIVPTLRERFPRLPAAEGDERALHEAALRVLEAVAAEQPVVLAVDDAASADRQSLGLLLSLARRLPEAGILLLLSLPPGDSALAAEAGALREIPHLRVRLRPLEVAETEAMLASMLELPRAELRPLAGALHVESGGNPFYVVELVSALVDEGYIHADAEERWRSSLPGAGLALPLPSSVREVVARRLARLSANTRAVLGAAAVLGEHFELRRLEAVGGFSADAIESALEELLTRRIVREVPDAVGRYSFSHALVRRVAYRQLLPTRREALLRAEDQQRERWWRRVWQTPDELFVDAGAEGEWLLARLRLSCMGLLLILPTLNLVTLPTNGPYESGFVISLLGMVYAIAAVLVLRRGGYRSWLGFATSAVDVSLVSLGLASFIWMGDPIAATNSKTTFGIYFLAILAASVRYDRRICISTGLLAILEYLGIVLFASSRWDLTEPSPGTMAYGAFGWNFEIGRLILLLAAAGLAWELVRRAELLRRLASIDRLTGLQSRSFFDARMGVELERARTHGHDLSLVLMDLDGFRRFNERLGRAAGDTALRAFGAMLRDGAPPGSSVSRYGADEFVLLLPATGADEASAAVDAIRREVGHGVVRLPDGREVGRMGFTAGVATFPADGREAGTLLMRAEVRLQRARQAAAGR